MDNNTVKTPSIKKNYLMNIILSMSAIFFPLISFPYVSRILGPEGTGKVSFAVSFVMYFDIFAQLGVPGHGIRACAKARDDIRELSKIVAELMVINITMTLIVYIVLFGVVWAIPSLRDDKELYVICSLLIILNSIGMNWLFQGLEKYTYITVRSLLFKIIALVGMFLLIKSREDYHKYAGLVILAGYASNILNLIYAVRIVNLHGIGKLDLRRHLKPVGVFFATTCATTVYLNLDNVMLGVMTSKTEVGYYSTAVKVKSLLLNLVTSLGTVLLPRLSYYVEQRRIEEFKTISGKSLHLVLLTATSFMVYFMIFAKPVIFLLSGEEYLNSVIPMQIIMPTLLFIGITNIMGMQILVPLGLEKYVLYSEIGGAVVDIILNALFIPVWGASGAAIGTAAAEITVLVIQYYFLKKINYCPSTDANVLLMLIAIIISSATASCTYFFGFMDNMQLEMGCFLTILISGIIFFGIYAGILLKRNDSIAVEIKNMLINRIRVSK